MTIRVVTCSKVSRSPDNKKVISFGAKKNNYTGKICTVLSVLRGRFFSTFAVVVETTVTMSQDMMDDGFFESR